MRCQDILQNRTGSRKDNQGRFPRLKMWGMLSGEESPQVFNLPSITLDDLLKEIPEGGYHVGSSASSH